MKTGSKFIIIIILLMIIRAGHSDELRNWESFARSADSSEMMKWLKSEAVTIISSNDYKHLSINHPQFYGRFGIFITLINMKQVRGCFGAFSHDSDNLESVLREYLKGALRLDNRYNPPEISELKDLRIMITITSQPYQISSDDLEMLDISRYGVMIIYENEEREVFVPAEIRTHSYLKKKINRKNISGIFAFKAITIK